MNKTFQDLKLKIESIRKTQTEGILNEKNLGIHTRTTEESFIRRAQQTKERILGTEDILEVMDTAVKEKVRSGKLLKQNVQEIWNSMESLKGEDVEAEIP